jgi:16S rRNA (guanine527-N7)-methyltransferase
MSAQQLDRLKALLQSAPELAAQPLAAQAIEQLVQYYTLVLKWNSQLHLTTIIDPDAFFRRHILESVFLAQYLTTGVTEAWDLGSGLGIPGVPLAVLRPDLHVHLVEASQRKAVFLEEVGFAAQLPNIKVLNQRFESIPDLPNSAALTARAIEQMVVLLPVFLALGKNCRQILLLGGATLLREIRKLSPNFEITNVLLPSSQARFLINLSRST